VRDKRAGSKAFIGLRRAVAALRVVARTAGDVGEEVTWGERKVTGGPCWADPSTREISLGERG
jgi:hypothetical protein